MDGMEQRMDGMEQRMDGMEQRMDGMEQRMDGMEQRMGGMEQRMDRFEILLEHDIPKQLQLLAEGHQGIVKCLPKENELDAIRSRVSTLERISADHSEEIRILKQAN
jgi:archaellum component FlaC